MDTVDLWDDSRTMDHALPSITRDNLPSNVLSQQNVLSDLQNNSSYIMTTQAYLSPLGTSEALPPDLATFSHNNSINGSTSGMELNRTVITMDSMVSLNYKLPIMIIVAAVLFVVIVATAFGNLLVGLALFKFRYLRTISNYLIGNLALSDFLLATTILPMSTVQECLGHWVFGQVMCNFWLTTDVLYCTASIWNLCIIAFDRFTATLYPVWYREKRSTKQAAIYVALVWIISTAICVPPLLGWNDINQNYVYNNVTNVYNCILFQTPSYVLYSASGSFYIPFFITFFLYVRIFMVLRRRMRKMRRSNKARNQNHGASRPAITTTQKDKPLLNNIVPPKPDREIEMTNRSTNEGSGNTEELSSKSLFGSDSGEKSSDEDVDEEDSSTQGARSDKPLCPKDKGGKTLLKNGIKKGTKTEPPSSILSPNNASEAERDSDMEKIRIVVTEDESGGNRDSDAETMTTIPAKSSSNLNKNVNHKKTVPAVVISAKTAPKSELDADPKAKQRTGVQLMNSAFKSVNPFGKEQKKKVRTSTKRRYEQREMRATIRMAIIIACFCGMWLGFFIIYVLHSWCSKCIIPRELDAFFFWLGYANSSVNPILYTIFNEEFRRAFQKILGCYNKNNNKRGRLAGH